MEILERIWEIIAGIGNAILGRFERGITGLFGSANARFLKRLQPKVDAINALEPKYQAMTDEELRKQTAEFRRRLDAGETLDDILVEAFAVCREGGRRFLGHAALRRADASAAWSCTRATSPKWSPAKARRSSPRCRRTSTRSTARASTSSRSTTTWPAATWNGWARSTLGLGLTVGAIQSGMDSDERQKAYACDITYGTNNEFGFDYLRDNMRPAARGDDRYPKQHAAGAGPAATTRSSTKSTTSSSTKPARR